MPCAVRCGRETVPDVASRDLVVVAQVGSSRIRFLSRGMVVLLVPCFLGLLATGAAGVAVRRRRREDGDSDAMPAQRAMPMPVIALPAGDERAVSAAAVSSPARGCVSAHGSGPRRAGRPLTVRSLPADSWGGRFRGGFSGLRRFGRVRRLGYGRALRRPPRSGRRRRGFRQSRSGRRQRGRARREASGRPPSWARWCPARGASAPTRTGWKTA